MAPMSLIPDTKVYLRPPGALKILILPFGSRTNPLLPVSVSK
jgi:hypothetical protein